MTIEFLSALFLMLCALMVFVVIGLFVRYLEGRARIVSIAVFLGWLLYVAILGYGGVIASKMPPGLAFLLLPVLLFAATFMVRNPDAKQFAAKVPMGWLIGLQVFRVLVELSLYELYLHRLIPRLMTFEGGNLDILIGLSAPIVAWLYANRRINDRTVRAWGWIGIILLTNIVVRAFLTSAGFLKTETPNLGLALFPFTFLPGFLAPLALYLHILLLRALPRKIDPLISNPGHK